MTDKLALTGVRQNNLKNLNLDLSHDQFTVITGVSGSGKSTLAFDTIYAEGGRRYIETFSPYTRQFLDRLSQPDIDTISGVRPALALEQRNRITSSRSTVGTITEINDYLKIIWSHLAVPYCDCCGKPIERETPEAVAQKLFKNLDLKAHGILYLLFEIPVFKTATVESLQFALQSAGHTRFYSEKKKSAASLEDINSDELANAEKTNFKIVVDRIKFPLELPGIELIDRLRSSISQCYHFGRGVAQALLVSKSEKILHHSKHSEALNCSDCEKTFPTPRPSHFTFNSPLGACSECHGFGKVLQLDPNLCIPDPLKSLSEGAIAPWTTPSTAVFRKRLKAFCAENAISMTSAWNKLSPANQNKILYGSGPYKGLNGWFTKLQGKRHKMHVRVLLARYRGEFECSSCRGSRLAPIALNYRLDELTLPDLWQMPISRAYEFFQNFLSSSHQNEFTEAAVSEVVNRLRYLVQIGLPYLTLDRASRTLSGGESQRVNLTAILGSRLVNTVLVLDEPTIGLHPRDTDRLISTIKELRDRGNTLVVVEHDPAVMRAADEILDLGPAAGKKGGQVLYQGPISGLAKEVRSLTGQYLNNNSVFRYRRTKQDSFRNHLRISQANQHNLKNISVDLPLESFTVITGASGSGKSTLLTRCLVETYNDIQAGRILPEQSCRLNGLEFIDEIMLIDQSPIGRTPRSNPATYTKTWELIRELLAESDSAASLGLAKSSFSFNVDGGRCPVCKGAGQIKVEMQFLADVYVECESCCGQRFQDKVLGVRYLGKTVVDFLNLTLDETVELFSDSSLGDRAKKITESLKPLCALGLGYLQLGHPLNAISGGEAQRIKLASHLQNRERKRCLFILDEPTTGLHPANIQDLIKAFDVLLQHGHSVVCIEHNLDVISAADWIVDLGPEGGEEGGEIVASGTPEFVVKNAAKFPRSSTVDFLLRHLSGHLEDYADKLKSVDSIKSRKTTTGRSHRTIQVVRAREHNLKEVSVEIPQGKLVTVTGVSGSGKSTLAFDILFAEGQRRYIDCLSPYARQYIKQLRPADVDQLNNIPPTVAISQKTAPPMGISTVATTTEIYQYLRLLFSKVGTQHCIHDDAQVTSYSDEAILSEIVRKFGKKRIHLLAPVVSGRKGHYAELFARSLKAEINQARVDNKLLNITPDLKLERHKLHWISLVVASISSPQANTALLKEAIAQCLLLGNGVIEVFVEKIIGEPQLFSIDRVCPECGTGYRELDPQDFSFRSARGVCNSCGGRGHLESRSGKRTICPDCNGMRIAAVGRHVYLNGRSIHELCLMTAPQLLDFFQKLKIDERLEPIVYPIRKELLARLSMMVSVGLDYIQLDRDANTISGGEAQRLRLAKSLGSPLTGVCYVLDEPSIGLHSQDHAQLMETLRNLRDGGNTVIVVEHDEDTIRVADHVIDVGPRGGRDGGEIVFQGSVADLEKCQRSLTGQALKKRSAGVKLLNGLPLNSDTKFVALTGVTTNNLKNLSVRFPLNRLSVVAGVSGAGKSSLIHGTLIPAVIQAFEGRKSKTKNFDNSWREITGLEGFDKLVEIDQSPVGKTSTSTPASFLGIFDEIRKLYAQTNEARARGWTASYFSFNTGKGKCPVCNGRGEIVIPMSFLPDATTPCESCNSLRYTDEALQCMFQGFSIGEILKKTFAEVQTIFVNHKRIATPIDYVIALGLGYLSLGQPTYTLSGGEAQRLKIARELSARASEKTLYVLDEPTVGLHMVDVEKLLAVLRLLIDRGNSVIVIEHNLDVIKAADYILELGPGPGDRGGEVLFSGTPSALASLNRDTPTKRFLLEPIDLDFQSTQNPTSKKKRAFS